MQKHLLDKNTKNLCFSNMKICCFSLRVNCKLESGDKIGYLQGATYGFWNFLQ